MEDRQGLERAYADPHSTYVAGDTLYVAGTKFNGPRDVWDDLKIPFGLTNRSQRYEDASRVLKAMPQIKRIVGHSLGGAVALEIQKTRPDLKSVTYGAPLFTASAGERYKTVLDPIAMFDVGATTTVQRGLNPHSYHHIANRFHTFARGTSENGYSNADGSSSLYR
jgi:pimeloyl-ACP methyl ester carboxylesterase